MEFLWDYDMEIEKKMNIRILIIWKCKIFVLVVLEMVGSEVLGLVKCWY